MAPVSPSIVHSIAAVCARTDLCPREKRECIVALLLEAPQTSAVALRDNDQLETIERCDGCAHWFELADGRKHGLHEEFADSGTRIFVGHYDHGKLHGSVERYWADNGTRSAVEHYQHGVRHGVFETYNRAGRLIERKNCVNDKLHGTRELFDHNGVLVSRTRWCHGFSIYEPPPRHFDL